MSESERKKRGRKRKGGGLRQSVKVGLPPGTPTFVGERKVDRVRVDIIHYDQDGIEEYRDAPVAKGLQAVQAPGVTWINVVGLHDLKVIDALGKGLEWHPLTQEDIVHTGQRPKVEQFPGYLFLVVKMVVQDTPSGSVRSEQVSLVVGPRYVVSFLEAESDVFDAVRVRIHAAEGRIRSMESDYLAYALVDAVVDRYFAVIEQLGDQVDELDEHVLTDPGPTTIQNIHRLKQDILSLRKAIWPLREGVASIQGTTSPLIRAETKVFFRDLYDHTVRVLDMVEHFRNTLRGAQETYLSSASIRMNEVMKTLTVVATIFIPLTFITGIYGMNFEYMPELKWRWGYFMVWGVMVVIGLGMLASFRRRKWL